MWTIRIAATFEKDPLSSPLRDDYGPEVRAGQPPNFDLKRLVLDKVDTDEMRITMFNPAQSVPGSLPRGN